MRFLPKHTLIIFLISATSVFFFMLPNAFGDPTITFEGITKIRKKFATKDNCPPALPPGFEKIDDVGACKEFTIDAAAGRLMSLVQVLNPDPELKIRRNKRGILTQGLVVCAEPKPKFAEAVQADPNDAGSPFTTFNFSYDTTIETNQTSKVTLYVCPILPTIAQPFKFDIEAQDITKDNLQIGITKRTVFEKRTVGGDIPFEINKAIGDVAVTSIKQDNIESVEIFKTGLGSDRTRITVRARAATSKPSWVGVVVDPPNEIFHLIAEVCIKLNGGHLCPPLVQIDEFLDAQMVMVIDHGQFSESVKLKGRVTVEVDLNSLQDEDGNSREEVQTEIVQMELVGTSSVLGPLNLSLRDPQKFLKILVAGVSGGIQAGIRSLGKIEEQNSDSPGNLDIPPFTPSGTADSFFDVFFELEINGGVGENGNGGGDTGNGGVIANGDGGVINGDNGDVIVIPEEQILHNETPVRLQTFIFHKPPVNCETYRSSGPVPLFDELGSPAGVTIRAIFLTPTTNCDHYLGYVARPPRREATPSFAARLTDQFGTGNYKIAKAAELYNPVKKIDALGVTPINHPGAHLVAYDLLQTVGVHIPQTVEVTNQFGNITVTTQSPSRLLVPSTKSLGDNLPPAESLDGPDAGKLPEELVDHFLCYSLESFEDFSPLEVGVSDQFDPFRGEFDNSFIASRPVAFCNPVEKQLEGSDAVPVKNDFNHLLCYGGGFKERRTLEADVQVTNQVGSHRLEINREAGVLCVPSAKNLLAGNGTTNK